jgi:hypothetical protein
MTRFLPKFRLLDLTSWQGLALDMFARNGGMEAALRDFYGGLLVLNNRKPVAC